ncbi:MAG TPA: hypothetical protein VGD30_07330 [Telluria sp.]
MTGNIDKKVHPAQAGDNALKAHGKNHDVNFVPGIRTFITLPTAPPHARHPADHLIRHWRPASLKHPTTSI